MPPSRRRAEILLTLPSLGWLLVFFGVPAILVLVLAFKPADATGGVGPGWTWDSIRALGDPPYRPVLWRTLWISAATAAACIALALPVSLAMARATPRRRNLLLLLVIVPFWTSFLLRVFAWRTLLQSGGLASRLLDATGWFEDSPSLLYHNGAVLFIMIYTQLPFAILPLYAAAEKFDFTLLEAARDLGASGARAFVSVFLPGVARGVGAAAVLVLVATVGMYVVPDIVGGVDCEMIGNKIAQRAQGDRNLPLASALAASLMAGVTLLLGGAALASARRNPGARRP